MKPTIVLVVAAILIGGCSLLKLPKKTQETLTEPSPITLIDPTATPTVDPQVEFAQTMANLLVEEELLAAGEITLTVTDNNESHAYGRFNHNYEKIANNAYWYAYAPTEGDWEIIYWGQDQVRCVLLNQYTFPTEFSGECV